MRVKPFWIFTGAFVVATSISLRAVEALPIAYEETLDTALPPDASALMLEGFASCKPTDAAAGNDGSAGKAAPDILTFTFPFTDAQIQVGPLLAWAPVIEQVLCALLRVAPSTERKLQESDRQRRE